VGLISGGEFACRVHGDGIGGRNLETALRLAMSAGSANSEPFVALCAARTALMETALQPARSLTARRSNARAQSGSIHKTFSIAAMPIRSLSRSVM